ncbi:MAG: glycoside hydrolase family 78 protein [Clostridiales bacterium]|jgi:alpha-L-rhamnosidase|nr:glycoside hydrolase family 78 protein [Clostridiales bacterium]
MIKKLLAAFLCLILPLGGVWHASQKNETTALSQTTITDNGVEVTEDGQLGISDLTTEFKTEPLGIDEARPLFGYKLNGGERGTAQTHYLIQVSRSASNWAGGNVVWASGTVAGNKTSSIEYGGPALDAGTRYYWRVTSTLSNGQKLTSAAASFETGVMQEDWTDAAWAGAAWITPQYDESVTSYDFEAKFRVVSGAIGIVFGHKTNSDTNFWQVIIGTANKVTLRTHSKISGTYTTKDTEITDVIRWANRNDEHTMFIQVRGDRATAYINGVKAGETTAIAVKGYGAFGLRADNNANEVGEGRDFKYYAAGTKTVLMEAPITPDSNPFEAGNVTVVSRPDGGYAARLTPTGSDQYATYGDAANTALLRKDFTAAGGGEVKVEKARLYSTALGTYDAYLNGARVSEDYLAPGWTDYYNRVQYQTYDVTGLVKAGAGNALGLVLNGGWYSGELSYLGSNAYDSINAVFAKLAVTYSDGSEQVIVTDASWKSNFKNPYVFAGILGGERYDARREIGGSPFAWADAEAVPQGDLTAANGWSGVAPYTRAKQRGREFTALRVVAQIDPPARETQVVAAKAVTQAGGAYIVDFGQNFAGVVRIKLSGVAGQKVTLRHGEILSDNSLREGDTGSLGTLYTANLRGDYARDSYTFAREETVTFQPRLTFHGFRYLEISGLSYRPQVSDIEGVVINSDLARTGYYETSNEEITNQIYHNIYWGQLSNFLSVPTDCPQRNERMGWTGDAMIFADTANYNMDTYNFYRKYMIDFRDSQHRPDNLIGENNELMYGANANYAPYPERGLSGDDPRTGRSGNHGDAIWSAVSVVIPYSLYMAYGDTRILEENYASMDMWYDYLVRVSEPNGDLLTSAQVHHGDWVALDTTDHSLSGSAYLAYNFMLMEKIAEALGRTEDQAKYRDRYERVKAAFITKFVRDDMRVFTPGAMTRPTQCSQLLAVAFGLVPGSTEGEVAANRDAMMRILTTDIETEQSFKSAGTLSLGFVSIRFLNLTLSEYGRNSTAYHMVQNTDYPSWGYGVNNGATTIWERWDSYSYKGYQNVGMNSFNHYSFGSVGEWMYSYSAGIKADFAKPGYENAVIKPYTDDSMDYVKGAYMTVRGLVRSEWSRDKATGKYTYKVSVPTNGTATVIIPAASIEAVTEGGGAVAAGERGIVSISVENGYATIRIGSGNYEFAV